MYRCRKSKTREVHKYIRGLHGERNNIKNLDQHSLHSCHHKYKRRTKKKVYNQGSFNLAILLHWDQVFTSATYCPGSKFWSGTYDTFEMKVPSTATAAALAGLLLTVSTANGESWFFCESGFMFDMSIVWVNAAHATSELSRTIRPPVPNPESRKSYQFKGDHGHTSGYYCVLQNSTILYTLF